MTNYLMGGSTSLVSYFEKLLVEKFRWIGFSVEFLRDFVITELATKLRKLGTLGTSAIDVRVNHNTTCCRPDNASVLVNWSVTELIAIVLWSVQSVFMLKKKSHCGKVSPFNSEISLHVTFKFYCFVMILEHKILTKSLKYYHIGMLPRYY